MLPVSAINGGEGGEGPMESGVADDGKIILELFFVTEVLLHVLSGSIGVPLSYSGFGVGTGG